MLKLHYSTVFSLEKKNRDKICHYLKVVVRAEIFELLDMKHHFPPFYDEIFYRKLT